MLTWKTSTIQGVYKISQASTSLFPGKDRKVNPSGMESLKLGHCQIHFCTDGNIVFRCDSDKNSLVIILYV